MNKKFIVILSMLLVTGVSFFYLRKHRDTSSRAPEAVEKAIHRRDEAIAKRLDSTLGKLILSKNWQELDSKFDPKKDGIEWGEDLEALQIKGQIKSFSLEDHAKLLGFSLKALNAQRELPSLSSSSLVRSVKQLPAPAQNSENDQTLKSWLMNKNQPEVLVDVALTKLVIQAPFKDLDAIQVYAKTFTAEKILAIHTIPFLSTKDELLKLLLEKYKKLNVQLREPAIIVLSIHPEISPKAIKALVWKALGSSEMAEFDLSLKAISNLIQKNSFNESEKKQILKKLKSVPNSKLTSFAKLKLTEIMNKLILN